MMCSVVLCLQFCQCSVILYGAGVITILAGRRLTLLLSPVLKVIYSVS